ncbi:MAG TPA: LLM class flavin-dependent oxidoreductase [Rhodopila sp.]|uniref:LLM class flavin-dependent oxidoreductase n=1 Tax=Rhodopila sp. TaxID=2480087 RepID=UPI002B8E5B8C|nr:LLM class flavin-dependent oxidoreductase [Rhodopila sp.]HVY16424.1 LLM class flavin-dependent oxidoreductase [Rhodopila sp.]
MPKAQARRMNLGAFIHETGQHVAAWRHPGAYAESGTVFAQAVDVARTAERGKFDLLFLADSAAVSVFGSPEAKGRMGKTVKFEPITLLSALSAVTTNLGFVATCSSTYNEPYTLARQFASLDQISGGRGGWNLVTSNNEAEAFNHGRDTHVSHADRYDRAAEFAEVVQGLWDSWDEDAFIRDQESGVYFDPAKMHVLNHKGTHFQVRGPLNVARSPQGRPVLVQAGASDTGRDLAARMAEVVFTAQTTFEQAKEFYGDVIARLPRYGRTQQEVKVLPGLYPVVGRTEAEAREKFDFLQSLIHPSVGISVLEHTIGVPNLGRYPLDGPVPEMGDTNGPLSRQRLLLEAARRDKLTLWELCLLNAGPRGHLLTIGTPAQIADVMEHWFLNGAADGFNVMPAWLPGSLNDFVDMVIPELQRRGLFRTEYEGKTLRENLGLPKPASRYAKPAVPMVAE